MVSPSKRKWSNTAFINNVDLNTNSINTAWPNFENWGIQWVVWIIIFVVTFKMFLNRHVCETRWNSIYFFIRD